MKELSCGSDRSTINNLINSLGRVERYDATQIRCCSFAKASDIADGVDVRLTNMAGGYPFEFGGATWRDSETLYLCGEFSDSPEKHLAIQEEMHRQAAMPASDSSRQSTRATCVRTSPTSAFSGCSTWFSRSATAMLSSPTSSRRFRMTL